MTQQTLALDPVERLVQLIRRDHPDWTTDRVYVAAMRAMCDETEYTAQYRALVEQHPDLPEPWYVRD